jgi:hypothetical protein
MTWNSNFCFYFPAWGMRPVPQGIGCIRQPSLKKNCTLKGTGSRDGLELDGQTLASGRVTADFSDAPIPEKKSFIFRAVNAKPITFDYSMLVDSPKS